MLLLNLPPVHNKIIHIIHGSFFYENTKMRELFSLAFFIIINIPIFYRDL